MKRARNDRNIIRFGPTSSSLESEVRRLRRAQAAGEFNLKQQILTSPEIVVPEGPGPVVVPGDLNTALFPGFPFLLNGLSGVFATTGGSVYVRQLTAGAATLAGPNGFQIAGNTGNMFFVEIPSGTVNAIPFAGLTFSRGSTFLQTISTALISQPQVIGSKIVAPAANLSERLAVVYNINTGQYVNLDINVSEITDFARLVFERDFPYFRLDSITSARLDGQSSDIIKISETSFAVLQSVEISWRGKTSSNPTISTRSYTELVDVVYVFDENLNYTLQGLIPQTINLFTSSSDFSHASYLGNYFVRPRGSRLGIYASRESSLNIIGIPSADIPIARQISRGYVDDSGRLVFMQFNPSNVLWEIHRISNTGVRSIIPFTFAGNQLDQPVFGDVNGVFTSTRPVIQAGVAAGPNNGYFVYGAIVEYFGEVDGTGRPIPVAIPAIWYTDGVTTQRIWTLPDSEEFPLELLHAEARNSHTPYVRSTQVSGGRLGCCVSHLVYDPSSRQVSFAVRRGSAIALTNTSHESFGSESLLYRVQL